MIDEPRKHPRTIVYLDGKVIVSYYAQDDPRNVGECSVTQSTPYEMIGDDPIALIFRETIMTYNGETFHVKTNYSIKSYKKSTEQTEIVRAERF